MLAGNKVEEDPELPRPPTPPRETRSNRLAVLSNIDPATPSTSHLPSPAKSSPTSSADSTLSASKKKVQWSGYKQFYPPPNTDNPASPQLVRQLSAPNLTAKPKSILKPTINIKRNEDVVDVYASFPEMLESAVQALASSERSKKQDTYATLANTLKAQDSPENLRRISEKMDLLAGFIRRDITSVVPQTGSADIQLNKNALKLLSIFVWTPMLCSAIPDDDAGFFYMWATSMVHTAVSKNTVIGCLYILANNRFASRIVTIERATRLIATLDTLSDRHVGSSITHDRIGIYWNLLQHPNGKAVLISKADMWMDHLLEALLSSVMDIRSRAIQFAQDAAKTIGAEKNVSRALDRILSSPKPNSIEKKFTVVMSRLDAMIKTTDAPQAAQIWGALTSLLRGLSIPIDKWQFYSAWVNLIAACFNSNDTKSKHEAHAAWSRLISLANVSKDTDEKHFDLLVRPISAYLDDKKPKTTKISRTAALDSLCTLLYYSFRPDARAIPPLVAWRKLVNAIVLENVISTKYGLEEGCDILSGLLDGNLRPWSEIRPLELKPIRWEDLPRLDPKWVRTNSAVVFQTMEALFLKTQYWKLDDATTLAPVNGLWFALTRTIAKAASKEVRTSAETMEAVASLTQMLSRIWTSEAITKGSTFVRRFTSLITAAVDALGPMAFTEKKLSNDGHNNFALVSTPSGRDGSSSKDVLDKLTPILHFFRLFLQPSEGVPTDAPYWECVDTVLSVCVDVRSSRRKKLELIVEAKNMLPVQNTQKIHLYAWAVLAEITASSMTLPKDRGLTSPSPAGPEFEDVLNILEWCCVHGDISTFSNWKKLYQHFHTTVLGEFGEAYVVTAVTEPLARIVRRQKSADKCTVNLLYGKALMDDTKFVKSKINLEKIQKILYGQTWRRSANAEAFEDVFVTVGQQLHQAFDLRNELCKPDKVDVLMQNLDALNALLLRLPAASATVLLPKIQDGISLWLGVDKSGSATMVNKMLEIWQAILKCLSNLPSKSFDSHLLRTLGTLIASGLESNRKAVVNATLEFWNNSFGKQDSMEYPTRVQKIMNRLRLIGDIVLPTFPETESDDTFESPPKFSESQDIDYDPEPMSSPTPHSSRLLNVAHSRDRLLSPGSNSRRTTSSSPARRVLNGKVSKTKLKHMDSQINFEPIHDDDTNMESQLLTERQREVKERQTGSGLLFKDIRPTTPPKRSTRSLRTTLSPLADVSPPPPVKLQLRVPTPQKDDRDDDDVSPVSPIKMTFEEAPEVEMPLPEPELPTPRRLDLIAAAALRSYNFSPKIFDDLPSSPPTITKDFEAKADEMFKDVVPQKSKADADESTTVSGLIKSDEDERQVSDTGMDISKSISRIPATNEEPMVVEDSVMLPPDLAGRPISETNQEFFTVPQDIAQLQREASESVNSNIDESQLSQVSPLPSSQKSTASNRGRNRTRNAKRKRPFTPSQKPTGEEDEEELECLEVSDRPLLVPEDEDVEIISPPAKRVKSASSFSFGRRSSQLGTSAPSKSSQPRLSRSQSQSQLTKADAPTPESKTKAGAKTTISQEEVETTPSQRVKSGGSNGVASYSKENSTLIAKLRRRSTKGVDENSLTQNRKHEPTEAEYAEGHAAMLKVYEALEEMNTKYLTREDRDAFKGKYWRFVRDMDVKYGD